MHTVVGGGGQHGGYDALDYRRIKHGDAGKLGNYPILSYLPDKFAGFLYDFHAFRFESLDLPPLPAERSDKGHFALYNCLVLGHTEFSGVPRIYCNPFPAKTFYGRHRLDPVMIQPPGIDNRALVVADS